jgi:hypothetical protein
MEILIVVSKVKAAAKMRVSREAIDALSASLGRLIQAAAARAKSEGVETIKARHVGPETAED